MLSYNFATPGEILIMKGETAWTVEVHATVSQARRFE